MNRTLRHNKEPPEWVQQQHKTMLRWVNSKLSLNLTDLSTDLCDGLVLIQLINKIISEMDVESSDIKLYLLKPLYTKPKLMLQKLENVNDFLEFIRLVLKISTISISADNIVEGNLKLILGLLWSLFIFSTTSFIGIMNDGNSLIQIKRYLLNWINSRYKLSEVNNFDRDWSLDISSPDMIFYNIAKCYMPISNHIKLTESKFQNLKEILQFSESLGIPRLADIDDFKKLVPDEKCILFYILEWFKFFELGDFDTSNANDGETQLSENDNDNEKFNETYDDVIMIITNVIKVKLEYETKALRLSNKIISITKRLEKLFEHSNEDLFDGLKRWDSKVSMVLESDALKELDTNDEIKEIADFLKHKMSSIEYALNEHKDINNTLATFACTEIDCLQQLQEEISHKLKSLDGSFQYGITKNLNFDRLKSRFDKLVLYRDSNISKVNDFVQRVLSNSLVQNFDGYLKKIEALSDTNVNKLDTILTDIEVFFNFIEIVDQYSKGKNTSIEVNEEHGDVVLVSKIDKEFSNKDLTQSYHSLKHQLIKFDSKLITNDMELTFILQELTTESMHETVLKNFISFVPVKYVNLSFNDSDFSLVLESEDEDSEIDNSKLIFENQRRKISNQLCHDKVFDLVEFFDKFEHGLTF